MIIGIDIGGTKIAIGLVDVGGRVLARKEFPTEAQLGFERGLEQIKSMIQDMLQLYDYPVRGIGVGCAGPIQSSQGLIGRVNSLPGWEGAPLGPELESYFNLPVVLENDADAAAMGEWKWGHGHNARIFLYVTIGTGIGGGLIVNGKLYRGIDGSHPEIGHHIINPDGPLCSCNIYGCWESLASGSALERYYHELTLEHNITRSLRAYEICDLDDKAARTAVETTGYYLGLGLANMITLYTPDIIVLGGGLMNRWDLFFPFIQQSIGIQTDCGYYPYEGVRILPAVLGEDAGVVGAACAWLMNEQM